MGLGDPLANLAYIAGRTEASLAGATYLPMDVTDSASVDAAVDAIGRLDIAVNGAGAGLNKATEETADDEFARVVDTNFGGTFRCCRAEGRATSTDGGRTDS